MELLNDSNPDAPVGEVIKSYLTEDGATFARDFWVHNRLGAQAGASVRDYAHALVTLGRLGAFSYDGHDVDDVGDGAGRTIHNFVVGPDAPDKLWNEVMTSPGTLGWNPLGASYYYRGGPGDWAVNRMAWEQAGCPQRNAFGEWADGGRPASAVEWGRMHPSERRNAPWPWPGYPHRRHGGRR